RRPVVGTLDLLEAGGPVSALADRSLAVVYQTVVNEGDPDLCGCYLRHGLRFDQGRVRDSGALDPRERRTRTVNFLNLYPSPASDYRIKARACQVEMAGK